MVTISAIIPWYAYFVNYLVCGILPPDLTRQQKKKFLFDVRDYDWEEPFLFKRYGDGQIRRCSVDEEIEDVIRDFHSLPYGGHMSVTKIAKKFFKQGSFGHVTPYPSVRHNMLP